MFSNLATKVALKKIGLPSDSLNFSIPDFVSGGNSSKPSKKLTKTPPAPGDTTANDGKPAWPEWMSVKSLPLTVQPWLTPRPPPIPVAEPPRVGDLAPLDRDRELVFGAGKKVIVVFLRCVGCAFAQKTFLALRAIASRHATTLTCVAVSHSSAAATQRWIDMMGGAWNVRVVIDEDRSVYAAWGLGLGSVWYVFNPTSQVAGFKERGWLGASVAGAMQKKVGVGRTTGTGTGTVAGRSGSAISTGNGAGVVGSAVDGDSGPTTVMGNKWQQAGAWAVDGRGRVVWGGRAVRADDVMDLEVGVKALGLV